MSDVRDPSWWWQYGLDGVIGGIIGASVTVIAVALTLRHERTLAATHSVRETAGRSMAAAMNLGVLLATGSGDADEHRALYLELNSSAWQVSSAGGARWPEFADLVRDLLVRLAEDVDRAYFTGGDPETTPERRREVQTTVTALVLVTGNWMRDPKTYERLKITADELRTNIEEDDEDEAD